MKRTFSSIVLILTILILAACNGKESISEDRNNDIPEVDESQTANVLVVYYSYSGTTERIAQRLQEKTNGHLYKIEVADPYPSDINQTSDRAAHERESGELPELVGELPDLSGYEMILVGGPVWTSTVAPPVMHFLEQVGVEGKEAAAFWTDSGNPGNYATDFKALAKGAKLHEGLGVSSSASEDDVERKLDSWLADLTLPLETEGNARKITITIGNQVIDAELNDSMAAQVFKKSLPTTVSMRRMGDHEYYGSLKNPLDVEENLQVGYEVGDLAFWTPGDLFAVYFDEPEKSPSGLMILGKITSDLSVFDTMKSSVEMRIKMAE